MRKFLKVLLIVLASLVLLIVGVAVANKISQGVMNAYVDTFSPVAYEGQLKPEVDEHGNYYFTTDDSFKVLHLTDVHIVGSVFTQGADKKAINAVAAMVSEEKPDLVIVTGDISFAVPYLGTVNNAYAHGYFTRLMETLGVYYTVTLGNHDSEKYNLHNREKVAGFYSAEELEYSLFSSGPEDVFGECNHVINVKTTEGFVTKSFVMIDSNSYTEDDIFGLGWSYDCIREDQIAWYESVIELYESENEELLLSLPEDVRPELPEEHPVLESLMFMHIPMMEVRDAYNEYVEAGRVDTDNVNHLGGNDGESDKVVYSSEIPEEMFETILELGSTKGVFYGHDHLNNFVIEYKGVTLSYGYSIDYSAYFGIAEKGFQRGCAVIDCDAFGFTVIHENYYQDKYETLYPKETVDMSK
jgi:3',5'-cyclic AMP phosphodiesterase CpdA